MTAETSKIKSKLAALSASFDDLEARLEPLFSQTLPETIIALEPLQQAKLQTLLPYLVYDLIFIYLKTRGIDPKTHPVVPELDRIREYFEKINLAENPPAKRTEIDKAAATRFIKNAIEQAQWKKTAAEADGEDDNNVTSDNNTRQAVSSPSHIPLKMTTKMIQRAAYEKEIKEQDKMETEEDGLEVFKGDDEALSTRIEGGENEHDTKGKGKETAPPATVDEDTHINRNKRRRPVVDPFAGYGDDLVSPNRSTAKKVKPSSEDSPQPNPSELDPMTSAVGTRTSSDGKKQSRSEKKAKKKTKGLATSTSLR